MLSPEGTEANRGHFCCLWHWLCCTHWWVSDVCALFVHSLSSSLQPHTKDKSAIYIYLLWLEMLKAAVTVTKLVAGLLQTKTLGECYGFNNSVQLFRWFFFCMVLGCCLIPVINVSKSLSMFNSSTAKQTTQMSGYSLFQYKCVWGQVLPKPDMAALRPCCCMCLAPRCLQLLLYI